jgi:hypothetical protein
MKIAINGIEKGENEVDLSASPDNTVTWTTLDAYLSGFLTIRGFHPQLIDDGDGRVVFSFEFSPKLAKALQEYRAGALVSASEMANATKTLRGRIYQVRRRKESNGISRKPPG